MIYWEISSQILTSWWTSSRKCEIPVAMKGDAAALASSAPVLLRMCSFHRCHFTSYWSSRQSHLILCLLSLPGSEWRGNFAPVVLRMLSRQRRRVVSSLRQSHLILSFSCLTGSCAAWLPNPRQLPSTASTSTPTPTLAEVCLILQFIFPPTHPHSHNPNRKSIVKTPTQPQLNPT